MRQEEAKKFSRSTPVKEGWTWDEGNRPTSPYPQGHHHWLVAA
jgi:hypothetical protein